MDEISKIVFRQDTAITGKDFIIRSYRDGDEIKINEMFNEVFYEKRDLRHWYWKYRDNPTGLPIISLAFSPDSILAAQFAAYPLKLWHYPAKKGGLSEYTIYHAGDKMTRRRFRSIGFGKEALLTRTYMHFAETVTQADTIFKYGFMTHHSLRFGLLLLNYTMIEPVPYRILTWKNVPGRKNPFIERFVKGVTVEAVSDIDETWTDFFIRNAPHYNSLVKKDALYLRWRYLQRPDRKYLLIAVRKRSQLAGWSVFYREGNKIIWGDALFKKGDIDCVNAVLSYVRFHPVSEGVSEIEGWFSPRPEWWDSILKCLGFKTEIEPNALYFCIGNYANGHVPEMVKRHFYYTKGDSDLF
jgi:hypothetical protein